MPFRPARRLLVARTRDEHRRFGKRVTGIKLLGPQQGGSAMCRHIKWRNREQKPDAAVQARKNDLGWSKKPHLVAGVHDLFGGVPDGYDAEIAR